MVLIIDSVLLWGPQSWGFVRGVGSRRGGTPQCHPSDCDTRTRHANASSPLLLRDDQNLCNNCVTLPKRPSCTKNTTESEFRYEEKIRYRSSKMLQRGLRNACFSRQKRKENGTDSENYSGSNILQIRALTFFSKEGSFGYCGGAQGAERHCTIILGDT